MPTTDKVTQTSAVFGTAIFGKTVFGASLSRVGGLPDGQEGGNKLTSPWARFPVAETTWTRV